MERLKDKVAIGTGGALGIGRVFSSGLANDGARVVIADIDEQAAGSLAAELAQAGPEGLAPRVDGGAGASAPGAGAGDGALRHPGQLPVTGAGAHRPGVAGA